MPRTKPLLQANIQLKFQDTGETIDTVINVNDQRYTNDIHVPRSIKKKSIYTLLMTFNDKKNHIVGHKDNQRTIEYSVTGVVYGNKEDMKYRNQTLEITLAEYFVLGMPKEL